MSEQSPYTTADLRAEAARQHAGLTDDPDFMGVSEGMEDAYVDSTLNGGEGKTWAELLPYEADGGEAYNAAQRKIHDLIPGADLSEWAVNLGADGLEPLAEYITADTGDTPLFRLHLAVRPDMPAEMRTALVEGLTAEIAKCL